MTFNRFMFFPQNKRIYKRERPSNYYSCKHCEFYTHHLVQIKMWNSYCPYQFCFTYMSNFMMLLIYLCIRNWWIYFELQSQIILTFEGLRYLPENMNAIANCIFNFWSLNARHHRTKFKCLVMVNIWSLFQVHFLLFYREHKFIVAVLTSNDFVLHFYYLLMLNFLIRLWK